ncbi:MAG: squalene synthase HpnC [Alphaproteobacteria bacterium]|nr:squalene synthase HpnC [Alphaproteobacteria bacterium]
MAVAQSNIDATSQAARAVAAADVEALIRANTENFPVGSFLIPKDCRPHVHAFYLFAREADDISDSATLSAEEKVAQLTAAQAALGVDGGALPDWAKPYHRSLIATRKTPQHGRDLLSAFIQDATKLRYRDWDDLIDYCLRSAASVGRIMMDIHGESNADIAGSDALCEALQVLNHLQDCKEDYLNLNRVYLPEPWLIEAGGGVADLTKDRATPAVRRVIDRCLDGVDELIRRADRTPRTIRRRGLRLETALIIALAKALSARLRQQDPVAVRVKVPKPVWLWLGLKTLVRYW